MNRRNFLFALFVAPVVAALPFLKPTKKRLSLEEWRVNRNLSEGMRKAMNDLSYESVRDIMQYHLGNRKLPSVPFTYPGTAVDSTGRPV